MPQTCPDPTNKPCVTFANLELGPPNATIHKIDEHVALADIEPLKNIYKSVLMQLNQACALGHAQVPQGI
jgi:succinyl-diaminopimelate desuccinylase